MKIASLLVIKKRRHFEIIGHVIDIFTNVDMINNSLESYCHYIMKSYFFLQAIVNIHDLIPFSNILGAAKSKLKITVNSSLKETMERSNK